jgi:hypothetical protein
MGCWSIDSFGNDDAADWVCDLQDRHDLSLVEETLDVVLETGDQYLEAPNATTALAAAEVIAAALGRPAAAAKSQEGLMTWIETVKPQPSAALVEKAAMAVDRVKSDQSELLELWQETDDFEAWKADVQDLRTRLAPEAPVGQEPFERSASNGQEPPSTQGATFAH